MRDSEGNDATVVERLLESFPFLGCCFLPCVDDDSQTIIIKRYRKPKREGNIPTDVEDSLMQEEETAQKNEDDDDDNSSSDSLGRLSYSSSTSDSSQNHTPSPTSHGRQYSKTFKGSKSGLSSQLPPSTKRRHSSSSSSRQQQQRSRRHHHHHHHRRRKRRHNGHNPEQLERTRAFVLKLRNGLSLPLFSCAPGRELAFEGPASIGRIWVDEATLTWRSDENTVSSAPLASLAEVTCIPLEHNDSSNSNVNRIAIGFSASNTPMLVLEASSPSLTSALTDGFSCLLRNPSGFGGYDDDDDEDDDANGNEMMNENDEDEDEMGTEYSSSDVSNSGSSSPSWVQSPMHGSKLNYWDRINSLSEEEEEG